MSIDNTPTEKDMQYMSDEDFMNMPVPEWDITDEETDYEVDYDDEEQDDESFEEGDLEDQEDADTDEMEDDEEDTSTVEDEDDEEFSDEEDEESEETDIEEDENDIDEDGSEDEEDTDETEEDEDEDETSTDDDPDYKALYEDLLAPFKANKKEIKVDSPEELRRLAQMGVGYAAKMAEIKPIRKIGKMLKDADLLDEAKISYLIDLSKKDSGAINKLIKDSGIDPLDLDTSEDEEYTPKSYAVSDKELDLDDTLDTLQETESGLRVINEVNSKWDESSKQVLIHNPHMLNTLEKHVADGTYDKIMSIIEKERTLNNVPQGVTDLQAYIHIGEYLAQQEATKVASTSKPKAKINKPKVVKRKVETNREKLRKAAAATKNSSKVNTKLTNEDIFSMSDEDFEKLQF